MDYGHIVREAQARRHALLAELEKLDALIDSASALAGMGVTSTTPVRSRTRARGVSVNPTRQAVAAILNERGRPTETRDLLPLIRDRGVEVGGRDPVATLSARLSNSKEFKIHRGFGWWFTDQPLPGAFAAFDIEETAGPPSKDDPAASNCSTGGSEDAAALADHSDRD